ncbi:MAG: nicotinate phosphoribosyltransferase [Spirochaetales bacterium]
MDDRNSALLTDLYELTMIQGYYEFNNNPQVVFDMFFRRAPFGGGFAVFAGLDDLLDQLEKLRFREDDLEYLATLDLFKQEFLEYLQDFRFSGSVYAVHEGSLVFPGEPLIRIETNLIEAQLIESMLLNTVNFQTLIATKAARVLTASNYGKVLEFGLRRAQGVNGAMAASRAAFIGGASATSNTLAGKRFGIPVKGTMAHSWVMAFPSEQESFERYAELYPGSTILLIDTYSTLGSGIEAAIAVGKKMKEQGNNFGVRLDSGDLEYLSKQVRRRLDNAGLTEATITASNELNEEIVHQLVTSGSPIDSWGVGTNMVTGGADSSLTGVYKLAAKTRDSELDPTIKLSNQPSKTTNPGVKQVYRFYDENDSPLADLIAVADEEISEGKRYTFYHPDLSARQFDMAHYARVEPLLEEVMSKGKRHAPRKSLRELQDRCVEGLKRLDHTYQRIINPHVYKVSLSGKLAELKRKLVSRYTAEI